MSNLVIVAIPDENDRVWKVSSEKIPHMTLLFLGDMANISNLETIVQFVEHAANTSMRRFYMTVDRRGELGADQADVLFFKKGRYDYKAIRDFRAQLLQESNIKTAYDGATQFEGPWNPHLTLGYPAAPAKPDPDEYPFYDVSFNKIAVWTGDFEGPDFLLKDYFDEFDALETVPMDVSMSGIDRDRVNAGRLALTHATTVSDTAWSQFKTSDYTDEQYARACLLDRGESAGTAKERYGLPVREPSGTLNRNACHAAAAVLSSTGGTGSARGNKAKGTPEQLAKAKKKLVALYKGPLDEDVPKGLGGEDSMAQTIDCGAEFLAHYGIKGMHWGQRTHREVSTKEHVDSGLLKRRTRVRTQGGEAHPAHGDAVVAAVQKQKLKKSGTDALSTQELRDLANRLQVENQVSILMSSKGRKFVQGQLEQEGKQALKKGAKKAAPHVIKRASKGAATAAATAALL